MSEQLTDTYLIERNTDWTHQLLNNSSEDVMPKWENLSYVNEKANRARIDAEYLVDCIMRFRDTGETRWLAGYRWRLQNMVDDVDAGCWYAVAEGAR